MTYLFRFVPLYALALIGAALSLAQTSTNVTLNVAQTSGDYSSSNSLIFSQTGSVGPLGNATLVATSSAWPIVGNTVTGPVQANVALYFNQLDSLQVSYIVSDPHFAEPQTFTMAEGTITGTGAYAGATGSLTLNVAKTGDTPYNNATTTGSGSLTVGANTTPLTLTNFRGWAGVLAPLRERNFYTGNVSVSGSLGTGSGTILAYYTAPQPTIGAITIVFNSSDQLNLWFTYVLDSTGNPPTSFSAVVGGGTGKYASANGVLTCSRSIGLLLKFTATGTITTSPAGAPSITQVKTAFGLPQVAFNTWLQINGTNLVPADTPSAGVDWSNAPDFANGKMPTQLGPISVIINGSPGFVYWYCSAATNPNCTSGDQINVLAPLLPLGNEGPTLVAVINNGVPSGPFGVFRSKFSPTLLSFDAKGHVVGRHLDSSLMGPASLYPGLTTPAKPEETIILVGSGFGVPTNGPLVNGSATQSGPLLPAALSCFVSGISANVAAALISPGLYQFNLTIPKGVPSGDNLVNCVFNGYSTFPGTLIAVQ